MAVQKELYNIDMMNGYARNSQINTQTLCKYNKQITEELNIPTFTSHYYCTSSLSLSEPVGNTLHKQMYKYLETAQSYSQILITQCCFMSLCHDRGKRHETKCKE